MLFPLGVQLPQLTTANDQTKKKMPIQGVFWGEVSNRENRLDAIGNVEIL